MSEPTPAPEPTPDNGTEGQPSEAGQTPEVDKSQERTFTQADVDRIVSERLAREKAQSEKAAEKVRQEAERKALAEQGEYRTLAEQHAARIAELEPLAGQVERLQTALQAQLDQARQGLPAHVTALLDRLDPADQLEYLAANREALQPPAAAPNVNASDRGTAKPDPKEREAEIRKRFRL